jgi:hypothetical protein
MKILLIWKHYIHLELVTENNYYNINNLFKILI